MGAGGKMDPTKLKIDDISNTFNCKLALHIRKKLRKHGIQDGVKVVFSTEELDKTSLLYTDGSNYKKSAYGTMSYLPAAFGGTLASVALRELMSIDLNIKPKPKKASKGKNPKAIGVAVESRKLKK